MDASELRQYERQIEEAFPYPPPEYGLWFRHMFGGMVAYVRGRPFSFVTDEGLSFKMDDYAQEECREEAPEARTLAWTTKYLIAPPSILDDPARLGDWIQRSVDYVVTLPPEKKGKGGKRR